MATLNKLNDLQVRKAKPKDKDYKLTDGGGLCLLVKKNGSKYWRLRYYYANKEKNLAVGVYPDISLEQARERRRIAKQELADGVDPSVTRHRLKVSLVKQSQNTFELIAREWVLAKSQVWSKGHTQDVLKKFENHVFPYIGKLPINDIDSPLFLSSVLKRIEAKGNLETCKRIRQWSGNIFKYGQAKGLCDKDPTEPLTKILQPPVSENYASLDIDDLPEFILRFNQYNCTTQTKLAMRLMMLTFVRTKELCGIRREEVNLQKKQWIIPKERMKKKRPFIVPLATQTIEIMEHLLALSGNSEYLLQKRGEPNEPMCNATILRVIYRIGYKGKMTGHGFRSVASTALNESQLFHPDAIELQLSHEEDNDVRAAYNKAVHLKQRTEMMQWWADKLDNLQKSSIVSSRSFT